MDDCAIHINLTDKPSNAKNVDWFGAQRYACCTGHESAQKCRELHQVPSKVVFSRTRRHESNDVLT